MPRSRFCPCGPPDPDATRGRRHHLVAVLLLASHLRGTSFTPQHTVRPLGPFYGHDDTTAVLET